MRKFEYKMMSLSPAKTTKSFFNAMGDLGWELVSLLPLRDDKYTMVFKREI